MSDMITIRVYASTKMVGSKVYDEFEVERELWESMAEEQQEEWKMDIFWNLVECWSEEL